MGDTKVLRLYESSVGSLSRNPLRGGYDAEGNRAENPVPYVEGAPLSGLLHRLLAKPTEPLTGDPALYKEFCDLLREIRVGSDG